MISLVNDIPNICAERAELIRIHCTFESYRDIGMFWVQDGNRALISMLDNNMTVFNNGADLNEIREFISVISPASVFCDLDTAKALFGGGFDTGCVMKRRYAGTDSKVISDELSSGDIYTLFKDAGLSVPDYPHFAVDLCHRLNHGKALYFGIKDKCAAVCFTAGDFALLCGIASAQKGFGSVALKGINTKTQDKTLLCWCDEQIKNFYIKNGFAEIYKVAVWENR